MDSYNQGQDKFTSTEDAIKQQQACQQRLRDPNFHGGVVGGAQIGAPTVPPKRQTDVSDVIDAIQQLSNEAEVIGSQLHSLADRMYGSVPEDSQGEKVEGPVRSGMLGEIEYSLKTLQNKITRVQHGAHRLGGLV